jgi:dolichol-phosphate mannosyltransferase
LSAETARFNLDARGQLDQVTGTTPAALGHVMRPPLAQPVAGRLEPGSENISGTRLSVVVPTRNEAGNLRRLKQELEAALAGISHEVIVVDDSTDHETRPLLRELASGVDGWRVIERLTIDQTGLATAVTDGMAAATGGAVCVMDGDLQHPPAVVPLLLAAVEEGADLAVASRYTRGGGSDGLAGALRHLVSGGARLTAHLLFPESRRTSDPLSGFFCVRRSAVVGLELRPVGFKILLELLVLCPDLRALDVPFVFGYRAAGESKASARQGLLYLRHLTSLFVHVPQSSLRLKLTLIALLCLAGFAASFDALRLLVGPLLLAWLLASLASSFASAALNRAITFRSGGGGTDLFVTLSLAGPAIGLALYGGLVRLEPSHRVSTGILAQAAVLAIPLALNLFADRRSPAPPARRRDQTLEGLARRLDADLAWWAPSGPRPPEPVLRSGVPAGLDWLIEHCADSARPDLVIQFSSPRPQPRTNAGRVSVILVPEPANGRVAVLVRRRKPFGLSDLEESIRSLESVAEPPLAPANRPAEAVS